MAGMTRNGLRKVHNGINRINGEEINKTSNPYLNSLWDTRIYLIELFLIFLYFFDRLLNGSSDEIDFSPVLVFMDFYWLTADLIEGFRNFPVFHSQ